jgi:hypothetical protein
LELREKEWDAAARVRERALADARDHLLLVMKTLGREQATIEARDARIADLEAQIDQYRQQIATLIASAIIKNRGRSVRQKAGAGSVPPAHRPARAPRKKPLPKPIRARPGTAKRASRPLQKRKANRRQPSARKRRR